MKRLIREMGALHQNMVKRGLWKEAGPAPKNVVPKGSPNGRSAPVAYTMAGRRSDTGAPGSITNTLGGYTQRMYDDIGRMTTRSEVPPSKVNLKRPTDDFAYPMPKASPLVKGYMQDPDTGRIHYNIPELHVSLPILNMPQRSGQPNDGMHYTVNNLGYITAYDSKNNNRRTGTRCPPFGLGLNNKGIMTGWNPGRPSYRAHPAQTPTIAPPLNDRGHEVPGWRSVNRHGKQIAVTPEGEAFAEYDRGEGNWLAYTDVPQETFKDKNSLLARLKRMGSGFLHPKGSPQPDNSTGPETGDIPGMELLDQDPEKIKSMNVFNDPVLKELFPNNQTSQQTTANGPALSALRTIMVPPKRTYTGPVPLNDRGHEVPGWRVVNQNGKQVAVTPEGEAFAEYDRGEGNWLAYTDVPQVSRVSPTPQPNPQVTPAPPAEEAPEQLDVDGLDTAPETGAAAPPADPATLANAFQDPKFLEYLKWGLPIGAALGLAGYAVGGSKPGTLLPWLLGGAGGGALLGGLYGHYYGGNGETPEGAEGAPAATVPAGTNPYVYGPDEIDPETRLPKECANMTMMPYGEKGSDTRALYNAIPFAGSVFRKGGPVKYVGCKKNWRGYSTLEYEVRDPATGGIRKLYAKPNGNFSRNAADYTWSMDLGDGKQGTVDAPNVRRLILNSFKGADWGIPYDPANPETGADDAAQLNLYTKQLGI